MVILANRTVLLDNKQTNVTVDTESCLILLLCRCQFNNIHVKYANECFAMLCSHSVIVINYHQGIMSHRVYGARVYSAPNRFIYVNAIRNLNGAHCSSELYHPLQFAQGKRCDAMKWNLHPILINNGHALSTCVRFGVVIIPSPLFCFSSGEWKDLEPGIPIRLDWMAQNSYA